MQNPDHLMLMRFNKKS